MVGDEGKACTQVVLCFSVLGVGMAPELHYISISNPRPDFDLSAKKLVAHSLSAPSSLFLTVTLLVNTHLPSSFCPNVSFENH